MCIWFDIALVVEIASPTEKEVPSWPELRDGYHLLGGICQNGTHKGFEYLLIDKLTLLSRLFINYDAIRLYKLTDFQDLV